jgi:hypothetical protein
VADLTLVTHCGLYCGLCGKRARIPHRALALKESLQDAAIEHWGVELPGFDEFWRLLGWFSDGENACPGCRDGGGFPGCKIRQCARAKETEACPLCNDYACELLSVPASAYPALLTDGKRMREKGLDKWLDEQKHRAKSGFVYADIRYRD